MDWQISHARKASATPKEKPCVSLRLISLREIIPNVPNINRDRFIELLDFICEKYDINRSKNSHKLEELLYTTNHRIRTNLPKNISQKSLDKCTSSGCFLFLVKPDVLQEMFVWISKTT